MWAQTWFGTFKRATLQSPHISSLLAEFEEPGRANKLFNLLETFRLNACIKRELPGLAREMYGLHPTPEIHDSTWLYAVQKLEEADLFIKEIFVDGGRQLKRLRPAPQGRAHRIRKRSNHVTLVLDSKND